MVDLVSLWVENKQVPIKEKEIEQPIQKDELTPYRIHQWAINKENIPTNQEYKKISEYHLLRDISSQCHTAHIANYVNKVKLPIKAAFWYCRSMLYNITKITTISSRKDKEKEEKIKFLQQHFECGRKVAEQYLDEFISDDEFKRIKKLYETLQ